MPEPRASERVVSSRIALPLEAQLQPVEAPSLIPADVWDDYQAELANAPEEPAEDFPLDVELIGTEDAGLSASISADTDVALYALSSVHLFSGLPRSSLEALGAQARQGAIANGSYVFRENDPADSFFIVLDGSVEIVRRIDGREVMLRQMKRGDAIGLLGLFSGHRRAADARALGDAVVLEVSSEALNQLVLRDPQLQEKVFRFYRERLLEGFLGSSALFSDVDPAGRQRLIGRFQERRLKAGETLVQPGEVANFLAILISGGLLLEHKPRAGEPPHLYELYPAQFVAATSALLGAPTRIKIFAEADSTVVLLAHREFTELVRDYPALRNLPARLGALARSLDRDVFCGHTGIPGL